MIVVQCRVLQSRVTQCRESELYNEERGSFAIVDQGASNAVDLILTHS